MSFTRSGQFLWVLSVLIAVIVWGAVKYEQDWLERDIRLPVITEGLGPERGVAVEQDLTQYVWVTVYAPKAILDRLTEQLSESERDFAAVLDLRSAQPGQEIEVPFSVNLNERVEFSGLRVREIKPDKQKLRLVQEETKAFEIKRETTGALDPKVKVEEWYVTPETVHLIGSQSNLDKVAEVRCVLNLEEIASTLIEQREPGQLLDILGHDDERLPLSVVRFKESSVELKVITTDSSDSWQVPVMITTDGNPADGLMLGNKLQTDPLTVTLTGDKNLRQLIRAVYTEPVNVSLRRPDTPTVSANLDMSVERFNIDPAELENLGLTEDDVASLEVQPSAVDVTFSIVRRPEPPARKTYRAQVVVNIVPNTAGLTAIAEPQFVDIVLQGPLSILDNTQALIGEIEGARAESQRFVSLSINLSAEQYPAGSYSFGTLDPGYVLAHPSGTSVVSVTPSRVEIEVKNTGGNQ